MEHLTLHNFLQGGILLFTGLSIWLATEVSERLRLAGCIVGLMAQPLWIIASWRDLQWGAGLLTVVFTISWIKGIIKIRREKRAKNSYVGRLF